MQDIRKALDDKDLDAVSIATPNHWHSLMTIWACQAGKDVYVEKPLSHNVFEGRRCVEAARKYDRIVQHGTQQRSSDRPGQRNRRRPVGQVRQAAGLQGLLLQAALEHRPQGDRRTPPADLDFNLWLGPAPEQPYHGNLVHYNWHWFWDFGNGDIGNQGVHEIDVARWAIKGATLPTKVWSLGGRFAYEDQGQTPNMQMAVFEYGDVLLVFEVRGLVDKPEKDFAVQVQGRQRVLHDRRHDRERQVLSQGRRRSRERLARFDVKVTPGGAWGSFLHAVRSRKVGDLQRRRGSRPLLLRPVHAANISYRLGEKVPFNGKTRGSATTPKSSRRFRT